MLSPTIKKRILLTGASGTVGYEVLKQLYAIKENFEITVFDVNSKKSRKKFKPFSKEVRIVYGDITKTDNLKNICFDKDVVIHLAAIIPPLADEKSELAYQVNTIGTEQLIRCLEQHSPHAFFLYSSSVSVYGDRIKNPWITTQDPLNPSPRDEYATTKIAAEKIIQNSKLDWSIFRLSAIMGGHKISKLMFHQPLNTSLEIATPEDTARAFVNAIFKQEQVSKKIFNLGGGENCRISYSDLLIRSFKIFGLGKFDFPPNTFADKNFHCGYYKDGNELDAILNFTKDTLDSYFEKEQSKISVLRKILTQVFKKPIKNYLKKQSEPLAAYNQQNKKEMEHYFNIEK
ncbi:MAG: NAD(P)-dependent oxidoreductase [Bacteroidetes bacterium]|nr:NAD(P)-dependent oxidoreductase [Bacteroidota bacterium]MBP7398700.1 NAD(P)-dependent oxidoreductase [Chitinophagales bacterium]MBK7108957.1 NAD(P)-dependent oxidoreductase [Bacteroidota bacterium]MBK8488718.1 NAD(P)-dependent oxidoreductase [Bacteroidota bacterium]MBK8681526.1 NAD(P)-dependent oxidoreductase [Bacteroidota bacterium]